ncbi:MAG: DUF3465 domain-containing protein [Candidatus Riflebacteria bacterium]|nr:DUF3465 domain-containing protein [Candidatus Riflebacteria bacterium]
MSKRVPELTWQDKAILVVIPIVVLVIFIAANHLTKDLTVYDAFSQRLPKIEVRDGGMIHEVLPITKNGTESSQICRVQNREGSHEFTFVYHVQGSETMNLQPGRLLQFYGEFKFDEKGGTIEIPYKGKSGRLAGWAVYENHRYYSKTEDQDRGKM